MSAAAGAAAAALVGLLFWVRRPAPPRVRGLLPLPHVRGRPAPVTFVGARLRSVVGRAPDPVLDARLGRALAVALGLAVLNPMLGLAGGAGLWGVAWWRGRVHAAEDRRRIVDELPEVTDLLLLASESGLGLRPSLEAVARHGNGRVVTELAELVGEIDRGARLADSLELLPDRVGEPCRPLVAVLASADRHGTPLLGPLELVGRDLRADRRRRAEESARRVPVKLLFPLVFCTLPAFALLTVVPLLAGTLGSLRP